MPLLLDPASDHYRVLMRLLRWLDSRPIDPAVVEGPPRNERERRAAELDAQRTVA